MTREEKLDWLYRIRSEIYVFMPKEWLIPMNDALDAAIDTVKREELLEDWTKKCRKFEIDYEARLKAEMVAMLTEIQLEIEKQCKIPNNNASAYDWNNGVYTCYKVVQQKIDALRGKSDGGSKES